MPAVRAIRTAASAPKPLGGSIFASPAAAQDRIHFPGRDGTTTVIRHGPSFELLASNTRGGSFDASPALVGDVMDLRGQRVLTKPLPSDKGAVVNPYGRFIRTLRRAKYEPPLMPKGIVSQP
jgi:hypothetical protein